VSEYKHLLVDLLRASRFLHSVGLDAIQGAVQEVTLHHTGSSNLAGLPVVLSEEGEDDSDHELESQHPPQPHPHNHHHHKSGPSHEPEREEEKADLGDSRVVLEDLAVLQLALKEISKAVKEASMTMKNRRMVRARLSCVCVCACL
jgi:hypothetical protein